MADSVDTSSGSVGNASAEAAGGVTATGRASTARAGTERWVDREFLRGTQYRTDANLAARQSIYAYQHPRIDLMARVLDVAATQPGEIVADIGCGNGMYLAELTSRGFVGRLLGVDLSLGMLQAVRQHLNRVTAAPGSAASGSAASGSAVSGVAVPGGPVALANADATVLPFRDGAVDLALAMHMLYHVPEPAQAVRELRRVVRPGGRVVIGLNGVDHLRELRAAIASARGEDVAAQGERLSLEDGETLARSLFARVTRHDFASELRVPGQEPIANYIRSMSGTQYSAPDPEQLVAAVLSALPGTPDGHYAFTTHAGCLICED